jgi:hypothetical protein
MIADQPEIILHPLDPDLTASKWVVVGASVQGTSHAKISLPCQDAHAYKVVNDSIIIAAVADGLGTAIYSQAGSQLAAASAVAYLEQELDKAIPRDADTWIQLVRESFLSACARLEHEARKNQAALRDYSTTLILAVLTNDWLVTGHIGDGAAVASLEEGGLVLISLPQNEEYVNVTFPLTMPDMVNVAEFKACPAKVKALALMSDGMQRVSIRTADNTPHQPFFEPLFRQLPGVKDMHKASQNLAEFMASERICSHTDDDKTLILIGRQRV